MFQWRKFGFFEKDSGEDSQENKKVFDIGSEGEVVVCASGRGRLFFGSALGYVACIDRSQEKVVFPAHEKQVLFIKRLRKQDVLVTVGIDEDMPCAASIKLWKMSNIDSGEPQLARTIKPFDNKFLEAPITCFDATDDLSQIILGLGDGGLLIIEGDLLRSNKSINQKYLRKPGGPCITSVHFVEETRESLFKTYCYVSTTRTVFSVITQMNSKGFGPSGGPQPELELDPEEGCELNCSTLTDSKMIAVARDQAVYCFMRADRGPGYFFEEPKKLIRWYNNHLILVSEDRKQPGKNTINIYDLANQLIAFNGKFENVVDVVYEWATLFVISKSGQMVRLLEKDLSKKIDMLFKRNLYSVAINLARAQKLSNRDVAEIYKKYGDHLYEKGDYDRAMEQYIETIKEGKTYVEPSYIIRNFLDSQRIDNLAIYLEALHANKCANKDHTTLLLNCFTKSKDISKLDRFIQESFEHERKSKEGPNFDIDTAIQVCRQAGYFNHALLMAKQHSKNHMYAKILVEDLKQFSAAIESVYEMNIIDAEHVLKQYGQEMMLQDPDATTKLLKTICTEFRGSDKRQSISSSKSRSKASEFIYVFVGNSTYLENFLEHIIEKFPGSDSALYNSLLELYLRDESESGNIAESPERIASVHPKSKKIMGLLTSKEARYDEEHALVLTKLYKFEEGMLYLYKKMKLYNEILQHYMSKNQTDKILGLCEEYQDQDQSLWTQALTFFSSRADECPDQVREVLRQIDMRNLLPPLMVMRMLAKNPRTPLGIVKDYLAKKLQEENAQIEAHEIEIQQYQEETEKMREEIRTLSTSAKTFQATKCSTCKDTLDLPVVHFLCMHSFHLRCLQESDDECPICSPEYRKVLDIKANMKEDDQETFNKLLRKDGFSAIANYFGRGILNPPDL